MDCPGPLTQCGAFILDKGFLISALSSQIRLYPQVECDLVSSFTASM